MAEDQNNIVDEVGGEGAPVPAPEPAVEAEVAADPAPEPEPETGPEVAPDRIEYMLPGFPQPISLPGNLSNEQRAKAISAYLQSDDAKRFIDRDTGAPPFVRSQVGGSPAQDRLANIKRFSQTLRLTATTILYLQIPTPADLHYTTRRALVSATLLALHAKHFWLLAARLAQFWGRPEVRPEWQSVQEQARPLPVKFTTLIANLF